MVKSPGLGFSVNDIFDWASQGVDISESVYGMVTGQPNYGYPSQMTTALTTPAKQASDNTWIWILLGAGVLAVGAYLIMKK